VQFQKVIGYLLLRGCVPLLRVLRICPVKVDRSRGCGQHPPDFVQSPGPNRFTPKIKSQMLMDPRLLTWCIWSHNAQFRPVRQKSLWPLAT